MSKIRQISYAIIIAILVVSISIFPVGAVETSTISAKGEYIWIGGRQVVDTGSSYKAGYCYGSINTSQSELLTYMRDPVTYQTFYDVTSAGAQRLGLGLNVPKNSLGLLVLPIVFPQFSSHYEQSYVRWKFEIGSTTTGTAYNIQSAQVRFAVFNDNALNWDQYINAELLSWYRDTERNRIVAEIESPIMYNWSGYAQLEMFFTSASNLDLTMIQIFTYEPEVFQGSTDEITAERQEQDFTNKGNDSTDELASAVPNESAGFMSSIQTFVKSMSTTDTNCNLKLPAAYIPAINNVTKKVKLWDQTPIDFDSVFGMLPESVLQIIQSLSTIGLTVYCFKELYSTISYVFTMKRGESEE